MRHRRLGHAGLQLSELSLGSWLTFGKQITDDTAEALMKLAYDHGVNFFDNAEIYARGESERVMGRILRKMEWPRDTWTVSSKVFFGAGGKLPTQVGLHRKHVVEACHDALAAVAGGIPRSLLLPPTRPRHAHRRNGVDHAPADHAGQGAVLGHQRVERCGDQGGPCLRAGAPPHRPHHGAAAVQPVPPRQGGGGVRRALRHRGPGHHHLEPPGQRHPQRQAHAWRATHHRGCAWPGSSG
jgi:hypothetical protein